MHHKKNRIEDTKEQVWSVRMKECKLLKNFFLTLNIHVVLRNETCQRACETKRVLITQLLLQKSLQVAERPKKPNLF